MQKLMSVCRTLLMMVTFLLSACFAFADDKIYSEVYQVTVSRHPSWYDGPMEYVVLGGGVAFISLLAYLYVKNGMSND